uniref:TM2 domain-containing protein n=1 Tax=Acrobeloides nanus TaxID=290746 RepID=A0A914ELL8_9BILA
MYYVFSLIFIIILKTTNEVHAKSCSDLLLGQYFCFDPDIDEATQQPFSCAKDNSIKVRCIVATGISCSEMDNKSREFEKKIENGCRFSNGKNFATALLLSVFFGWLGLDRFYLGYYAIEILMCTLTSR